MNKIQKLNKMYPLWLLIINQETILSIFVSHEVIFMTLSTFEFPIPKLYENIPIMNICVESNLPL